MGYYKAQIDKNRREELKIIQRGGLEELAESYPGDSRLLKVVHGLEDYERKNIRTAVLECTDGESNQSTRYYKALARLIDIQVKMPDAEEWLPKKYDTPEKAAKEFKRLGNQLPHAGNQIRLLSHQCPLVIARRGATKQSGNV